MAHKQTSRPTPQQMEAAVQKLVRLENRTKVELMEEATWEYISVAVCINPGCTQITYTDLDADGYECPKCGTHTIWSIMELVAF